MDAEVMEYLDLLKNNVSELCSLGKQWGMTEAEVSSCINEVIDKSGYIPETRVTTKSVCRKIWWTIRCSRKIGFVMLMILWIAICVVGLVMAVSSYNEDVGNVISKTLQPYGYDIFRYLRLAALPLHGVSNITQFYNAECLVTNPYFSEPDIDCVYCEGTTSLIAMETINSSLVAMLLDNRQPVLHQGGLPSPVTYRDLRETYLQNQETFDGEGPYVESTRHLVQSLSALFSSEMENTLNTTDSFVVKWFSKGVKSSKLLRQLFPRPTVIPAEMEIALEKKIYLDGPDSQYYQVVRGQYPMAVYVQASGRRKAILRPRDSCQVRCQLHMITLNDRDTLLYDQIMWKLFLLPNIQGISVGISSTFLN